jgi:hypothetical protein
MPPLTFTSNRFQSFFRVASLVVIGCSGYLTAFGSQASSPNYKGLFWSLAPYASFQFVAVAVYFWKTRDWSRWLALAVCVVALFSFGELALRVL